jgi:nucleoside-diphosphate-sugar epimerase
MLGARRWRDPSGRSTLLVTGGTGVLGHALVPRLARSFSLVCLGHERHIDFTYCETVFGDITRPRLGLSLPIFRDLIARIDAVVHSAASTSFVQTPEQAIVSNVIGTQRVLDVAAAAQVPLYHLSSAFVDRSRRLHGQSPPPAYESSKREAESLVSSSGLPATILRPSVIIGDSHTGEISAFQGFHFVLGAFLRGLTPVAPVDPTSMVDFVPQDLVADVIHALISAGIQDGTYWITAGEAAPSLQVIADICLEYSRTLNRQIDPPRFVSPDQFERLIAPVFLPALPSKMRATLSQVTAFFGNFVLSRPFPSSLQQLRADNLIDSLPDFEASLRHSLEYWGQVSENAPQHESAGR